IAGIQYFRIHGDDRHVANLLNRGIHDPLLGSRHTSAWERLPVSSSRTASALKAAGKVRRVRRGMVKTPSGPVFIQPSYRTGLTQGAQLTLLKSPREAKARVRFSTRKSHALRFLSYQIARPPASAPACSGGEFAAPRRRCCGPGD